MKYFKRIVVSVCVFLLSACSDSDTSVDNVDVTAGDVPNSLVGVYRGTISAKAEAGLLSERFTEPVTITVSEDNTVTFSGDDPDEVFTTTIGSNGGFNGSLTINEGECEGVVNVSGTVDGSTASGDIGGDGKCRGIDVDLTGSFSATK
ncbi:MAG: hypothetical protein ACRBEE_13650 [Arenicella sp.]